MTVGIVYTIILLKIDIFNSLYRSCPGFIIPVTLVVKEKVPFTSLQFVKIGAILGILNPPETFNVPVVYRVLPVALTCPVSTHKDKADVLSAALFEACTAAAVPVLCALKTSSPFKTELFAKLATLPPVLPEFLYAPKTDPVPVFVISTHHGSITI